MYQKEYAGNEPFDVFVQLECFLVEFVVKIFIALTDGFFFAFVELDSLYNTSVLLVFYKLSDALNSTLEGLIKTYAHGKHKNTFYHNFNWRM